MTEKKTTTTAQKQPDGSFSDLAIWSVLCFIFGAVFILGSLKMKKADKSNTDAAE